MALNGKSRVRGRVRSRHTRRCRRAKRAYSVVLATVIALTALLLSAAPASAHDVILHAETSCQTNGTWTVNWEVINNQPELDHYMLVRAAAVDQGTLVGITANPSYTGIVDANHPDASQGGGTIVPPSGFGGIEFTSPGLPASQGSVTLTMTGFWSYPTPNGVFSVEITEVLTVDRPPECVDSRLGRIEVHKSSTGTSAPAGPFVFEVVQNDVVVTTISVPANGSAVSAEIPPGTYTLVEVQAPPAAVISPNPVTVAPAATVVVTAVNPYPDVPLPPVLVEAQPPVVIAGPQFTG
jgi:hypothetical protein